MIVKILLLKKISTTYSSINSFLLPHSRDVKENGSLAVGEAKELFLQPRSQALLPSFFGNEATVSVVVYRMLLHTEFIDV